jgi:hypothetical protein
MIFIEISSFEALFRLAKEQVWIWRYGMISIDHRRTFLREEGEGRR